MTTTKKLRDHQFDSVLEPCLRCGKDLDEITADNLPCVVEVGDENPLDSERDQLKMEDVAA